MPDYDLDEWVRVVRGERPQPSEDYITIAFPTDEIRDAYLESMRTRPVEDVRALLRRFLSSSTVSMLDRIYLEAVLDGARASGIPPQLREVDRRRVLHLSRRSTEPPLSGVAWVLDLLPQSPATALEAVSAYLTCYAQDLGDWKYSGICDAMSIIRHYFILQDHETREKGIAMLRVLDPRDMEFLVAALFEAMGYEVTVTAGQKDGGKDVIARRGLAEMVYIECKNWREPVNVHQVRALAGTVSLDQATRGILISVAGFTEKGPHTARDLVGDGVDRPWPVELIAGHDLVLLLNEHLGPTWPQRLDRLIQPAKAASAHASTGAFSTSTVAS